MNLRTASIIILAIAILGAGAYFYQKKNKDTKLQSQDQTKKALDDSHIIGVLRVTDQLYVVWPGNEISPLDHTLTFQNGTVISTDGTVTAKSGGKITLQVNELLTQAGEQAIVDLNDYKVMAKADAGTPQPSDPNAKHGLYVDYTPLLLAQQQQAGNKVVLYFTASWCPFCKAANKAFLEKIDQIPENVSILKVDYDQEVELKQKYSVTYQHTFVQVDAQGNEVTRWSGGDVENLKKYLK